MFERIKKYTDPIAGFWLNATKKARMIIISCAGAVIAASIIIIMLLNANSYVEVVNNLSATESSAVMARLTTLGIKGKSEAGAIYVKEENQDEVILDLAINPISDTGFTLDIFDKGKDLTVTDKERDRLYIYQLQERMQAMLKKVENVNGAYVTINKPEESGYVFKTDEKKTTVAVVLHVAPGRTLSLNSVAGINSIICSAVGVESADVSIIDGNGINLKTALNENGTLSGDEDAQKMQVKAEVEERVQNKLAELLSYLGEGNVKVVVNAVINIDKELTETKDYSPEGDSNRGVVNQYEQNIAIGNEDGTGYVPGVDPDAEGYQVELEGTEYDVFESGTSVNYLVDEINRMVEKKGYALEDISAAVVVNKDSRSLISDDGIVSTEVINDIVTLIENGGGITPERITVQPVTFGEIPVLDPVGGSNLGMYLIFIIAAVLLVIIATIIIIAMKKKKEAAVEDAVMPEETASSIFQVKIPDEIDLPPIASNETLEQRLKHEIVDFAKTDPSIVASLIKGWLMEED